MGWSWDAYVHTPCSVVTAAVALYQDEARAQQQAIAKAKSVARRR